jgi:hypothetical protein
MWLWIVGIAVGGLFVWLGRRALAGSRGARVGAAIAFGLWAFVAGILGTLLTLLWTVTDHRFAHANENLLLFNPLWLVLMVLLPRWILNGRSPNLTRQLLTVLLALSGLALVAHLGLSRQHNIAVIGLALPIAAALWYVVRNAEARNVQEIVA